MSEEALASGQMSEPVTTNISPDKTVEVVSIPMNGNGTDDVSDAALATLRDDVIPSTIGKVGGVEANVTGMTAGSKDFNDSMKSHLPIVFAFVLGLAFLLLLVTFRSIVVPIKAIVLNLLSVGAAYGILTLVFQDGHGESLLGFESIGGITSWLPLFLFVILFGLSMDYHVFILSRIREAVDRGMKTDEAVAHGIKQTAGVVTSAAVVMVAVFSIFGSLSMIEFKKMGVGLAVAVLIDATIVRGVLLPATMKLLGEWNWYLPKRLNWLPKFSHEHAVARARATRKRAPGPAARRAPAVSAFLPRHAHRRPHRRRRLPRTQRGHPRHRPQGHQPSRPRVRGLPLWLGGGAQERGGRAHQRDHARHPAPRRHDPRLLADQPVQGRRRRRPGARGDARATGSTR